MTTTALPLADGTLPRWHEIYRHTTAALAVVDPGSDRLVFVTGAFAALHGYTPDDLMGRSVFDVYPPEARGTAAAHLAAIERERVWTFESRHLRRDGSTFPVRVDVRTMVAADGRPLYRVATCEDLSEQRRAEEAEAGLAAVVDASADAIFSLALDGRILAASRTAERITGVPRRLLVGRVFADLAPPSHRHALRAALAEAVAGRTIASHGSAQQRPDGSLVRVAISLAPARDPAGGILALAAVVRDVSERHAAEVALRRSERQLRVLLDAAPVGISQMSPEGRTLRVNQALADMLGYAPDELLALDVASLTHPDDREQDARVLADLVAGRQDVIRYDKRLLRRDGAVLRVRLACSMVRDERGIPRYGIGIVEDVTERERARDAERAARAELEAALAAERAAREEAERARRRAALLASASRALGDSLDYRRALDAIAHLLVPALGAAVTITLRDGETVAVAPAAPPAPGAPDVPGAPDDGTVLTVPVCADGAVLGAITLVAAPGQRHDAADVALVEELARRLALAIEHARLFFAAEEANRAKMQFLATMSHELRTPLNAIAGHVQLLELGIHGPVTDAQREALDRVDRAQHHLLALINDVLNFARMDAGHVEVRAQPVAVAELIGELEPMVRPQLAARRLRFTWEPPPPELCVRADPDKVWQVLLNLLSNAIKFTPEGGTIAVTCAADADDAVVRLRVRDSGMGIPPDKLERIFEPFVQLDRTLASRHQGTGLGLAISRELARAMGGELSAESVAGAGSTFTLTLPRSRDG